MSADMHDAVETVLCLFHSRKLGDNATLSCRNIEGCVSWSSGEIEMITHLVSRKPSRRQWINNAFLHKPR